MAVAEEQIELTYAAHGGWRAADASVFDETLKRQDIGRIVYLVAATHRLANNEQ